MGWDIALKMELVKGMCRGDGHLAVTGSSVSVVYTTVSRVLAAQLDLIFAQLGYFCSRHEVLPRMGNDGYPRSRGWVLTVSGRHSLSLAEMIWKDVPEVWGKHDWSPVQSITRQGYTCRYFMDEDYIYLPIKSIDVLDVDKDKDPYVYAINVEDTHSYVTDNICSFNSSKSGLQVFLRRLLSLRQYFEATWIYPKLINPICEINGWSKSSPSEIAHNFRVKRGQEDSKSEALSLKPRIRWKNKLDPMVDSDMIQAYQQLRALGFPISKDTIGTSVYLNWENELEKEAQEFRDKEEILQRVLGTKWKNLYEQEQKKSAPQAKPTGAPGSGAMPPGAQGKPPAKPMDDASKPPGSAPGAMPNAPTTEGIEAPSGGGVPEGV
jgi:hypothetical protein